MVSKLPGQIKKTILALFSLAMILLLVVVLFGTHWIMQSHIHEMTTDQVRSVNELLKLQVEREKDLLTNLIHPLLADKDIRQAFRSRDRQLLSALSHPLYNSLFSFHNISHFDFHDKDGRNFLRLHAPSRHGDVISRFTLRRAMQSGLTSTGIEIGSTETLTLRVVRPWHHEGELLGYVELGKEVEYIVRDIKNVLKANLLLTIDNADGEQQVIYRTTNQLPERLLSQITLSSNANTPMPASDSITKLKFEGQQYMSGKVPLFDTQGINKGTVFVINDVTGLSESLNKLSRTSALFFLLVGVVLSIVFYLSLCRLENKLLASHTDLEKEIKERTQAEKNLEKAKNQAEAANIAKGHFLANMSHEIRTPMNGVLGFTDLLLKRDNLPPKEREYLKLIKNSSRHLITIINDILDFSKIESKKLFLEKIQFNPHRLVEEQMKSMGSKAKPVGLELRYAVAPNVPHSLIGDPDRLSQILINLLSNAIKFTSQGYVQVEVVPWPDQPELSRSLLHFSVKDTGIGIAADKQRDIFESFTQADGTMSRKFGGTGLGLSISKELTALMGGKIWLESVEGKGATFHFTASFGLGTGKIEAEYEEEKEKRVILSSGSHDHDEPEEAPSPVLPETEADKEGSVKHTILLVEDDEINRILALALLQDAHCQVHEAKNGREAVEQWNAQQVDLILMDIQMPEMDGLQATREIRAQEGKNGSRTPIIAVTAHAMEKDKQKCLDAGMDDYISKPIQAKTLYEMIERYCNSTK